MKLTPPTCLYIDGEVANYDALPAAADHPGETWIVLTSQGVWGVNLKRRGLWYSDGATWERLGAIPTRTHDELGDVTAAQHHDEVTLAGTPNYITITGQVITRALVNLASHVTGLLPWANLNKTGSSLADLATRTHGDLSDAPATAHHTNANDPSAGEKAALPGTSGTPGAGNKYVTNDDSRNTDDRTPLAHGSSKHTGKIGEVPFILTVPLAQPLANGTLQAAVDYEHRDWGNGVVRINRIYARARSNVSGDVTLKLHRNGAATHANDTVTISSGARESSVTTLNAEITLANGDYLDIEQTTSVTDDIAVDFYVLGDQDVVAAV